MNPVRLTRGLIFVFVGFAFFLPWSQALTSSPEGVVHYIPGDPPLSGVGLVVQQLSNDSIMVSGVFDNTPAQKSGIRIRDIIVNVESSRCWTPKFRPLAKVGLCF